MFVAAVLLAACCPADPPAWAPLDPVAIGDTRVEVDLAGYLDNPDGLTLSAEADDGVLASLDGTVLSLVGATGFEGTTEVRLTATDRCEASTEAVLSVTVGDVPTTGTSGVPCLERFTWEAQGDPDEVYLAGVFNDWDPTATPLARDGDVWSVDIELAPGAWPYKFVEVDHSTGSTAWACDPAADYAQCDAGYGWDPTCPLGGSSCNSLRIVASCDAPRLSVSRLDVDRDRDSVTIEMTASEAVDAVVTLDDEVVATWSGTASTWEATLPEGRHTVRVAATNAAGVAAEPLYVPFWLDDRDWSTGLLYYVFVDRFANGDPSLDASEGTTHASTDYVGGDWQGVIDQLDALDELGVTVLWLTAPQDNAQGAWDGLCGATYSGYHGYWPSHDTALEEHFGDEATLRTLVDEAHARGMRVLTDWVANHVHVDHPWYQEHPEWFGDPALCGDANNWNDIPETCWFAEYLPDFYYYEPEPLVRSVDDAIAFVKAYELDGYRVDAVKHMPHSLFFNFQSRVRNEIEHTAAGGDEDFYTVGETFSGDRALIASYVNDRELDAQFDFPVYWAMVAAFARNEIGLSNGSGSLQSTFADSEAAFAGHTMSTFLGNHDVARFLAHATGEVGSLYGDSPCGDDGQLRWPDGPTDDPTPYARLRLAWTFLLTSEGLPLVYYGDEIGLPGYADPDNRQLMRFGAELSANEAATRAHVATLGQARRAHPALSRGTRTSWWEGEADVYAYARVTDTDQALVLLNRGGERTLENGLAFAGLDATTWVDLLSGESFTASGDRLSVHLPALSSRVLVPR